MFLPESVEDDPAFSSGNGEGDQWSRLLDEAAEGGGVAALVAMLAYGPRFGRGLVVEDVQGRHAVKPVLADLLGVLVPGGEVVEAVVVGDRDGRGRVLAVLVGDESVPPGPRLL